MYCGKHFTQTTTVIFGEVAAKNTNTEFGIECAKAYCMKVKKLAPQREVTTKEIIRVIRQGKTFFSHKKCKVTQNHTVTQYNIDIHFFK
jgi:hypothetical protein